MFGWFKKKKENSTTENNSSVDFITQLKVVEDGSVVIEARYVCVTVLDTEQSLNSSCLSGDILRC
jgi:hypothetical protein